MTDRKERDERRERWVQEMGLQRRYTLKVQGGGFVEQVIVYGWEKGGERRYERDVILLVYDDGSFTSALDDGTISYDASKHVLNAMAVRADAAYHEANALAKEGVNGHD
jgi:hypothetical protein